MNSITLNDLEKLSPDSYILLDIRGTVAYAHGHIPGAVCWKTGTPIDSLSKEKMVIAYCSVGIKSMEFAEELCEEGYQAASLEDGFRGWLLEHYNDLTAEEQKKYDRQIILPEIGVSGQQKLKNASVLIVGAGGLGAPAALYLAGAGIGTIGIMDADEVSVSNLHRQIIHTVARTGINKAESAKTSIQALNDLVNVNVYTDFLTPDNAEEIISQYDFVLDAVDNFETKYLINDTCVLLKKPFCHGGVLQFMGQVMTYVPGEGPCYRCMFEKMPDKNRVMTCNQAGVLGPVVGIIGCMQALEVIKYLTGSGDLLTGRLMIFDGFSMEPMVVSYQKNPECRACGSDHPISSIKENWREYSGAVCSLL